MSSVSELIRPTVTQSSQIETKYKIPPDPDTKRFMKEKTLSIPFPFTDRQLEITVGVIHMDPIKSEGEDPTKAVSGTDQAGSTETGSSTEQISFENRVIYFGGNAPLRLGITGDDATFVSSLDPGDIHSVPRKRPHDIYPVYPQYPTRISYLHAGISEKKSNKA